MQAVPSEHQKNFFCCEDDQALAQVEQRGCGVTILEEKKFRCGPEQLAPGGPALAGG